VSAEQDPLWEARFAEDLLWRLRGGSLAHDDELERAARGVSALISAYESRGNRLALLGHGDEPVQVVSTDAEVPP
jgi:hypothetical protein